MRTIRTKENCYKVYHMHIYNSDMECVGWAVVSAKFLSTTISAIMDDGYTVNIYKVRYFDQECKAVEIHSK